MEERVGKTGREDEFPGASAINDGRNNVPNNPKEAKRNAKDDGKWKKVAPEE